VLWRRESSFQQVRRPLPQETLSSILNHGLAPYRVPRTQPAQGDKPDYDYLVAVDRVYDVFIAVFDVPGLEPGIYLYDLRTEHIQLVRAGEFRSEVQTCLIGQQASLFAGAVLFLTTDYRRIQWFYRHDRVIRNTYINSGKIMQSLILVATAHGCRTSITPAVSDRKALQLLQLDDRNNQVLYTLALT
jgi:SagB-type dehydrogenase family enzyme